MCHHYDSYREWTTDREPDRDETADEDDGPLSASEPDVDVELLTDGGDE